MESGNAKLRVVWICHFLNREVKQNLGIDPGEGEFTPWVSLGIEEAKKRDDLELHIIAPILRIGRSRYYQEGNVHYHFLRAGVPGVRTAWPEYLKLDRWTNYRRFNRRVRKVVKGIHPDVIDLVGAEVAYYSSSILGISGYPVIITIQGFIFTCNPEKQAEPDIRKRIKVEDQILRTFEHFGLAEHAAPRMLILEKNPRAQFHSYQNAYAKTELEVLDVPKEYDVVFFANLIDRKGIEDLIRAIALVKGERANISLCVIGKGLPEYEAFLRDLVKELGLEGNISFKGFLQPQRRLHEEVIKARIMALPTYVDRMPGTIVESMHLGLPVISTRVGGIPYLNEGGECIRLIDPGEIDALAREILALLNDPALQQRLIEAAREYARMEFSNARNLERQMQAYEEVIRAHPDSQKEQVS